MKAVIFALLMFISPSSGAAEMCTINMQGGVAVMFDAEQKNGWHRIVSFDESNRFYLEGRWAWYHRDYLIVKWQGILGPQFYRKQEFAACDSSHPKCRLFPWSRLCE